MIIDLRTLQSGDSIKLRTGEIHTVNSVEPAFAASRLIIRTADERTGHSQDDIKHNDWHHSFDGHWSSDNQGLLTAGDIVEILPKNTFVNGAFMNEGPAFGLTDSKQPAVDAINPAHYQQNGIQTIDAIEAWGLNFCLGNAVKYISRAGKKDEKKLIEDLKKAIWYIEREIKTLEKK